MTVIAVRIKASPPQASNPQTTPSPGPPSWVDALADRVDQNVVGTHAEAVVGERSPMSSFTDPTGDVPDHVRGVYRFESSETLSDVLDTIEADVVADAEWHRIKAHTDCDHGEAAADRTGCSSWSVERENGTVPSGV